MAKLSFTINQPPPPKPMFPGWFRGALFIFILTACSALITVTLYGDPHAQLRALAPSVTIGR